MGASRPLLDALLEARDLGFLGPGPIEAHVEHASGFGAVVEGHRSSRGLPAAPPSLIDLGSGGGVPGLVLAERWPEARVLLVDASERRTEFVARVARTLPAGGRVEVIRGRTEELGRRPDLRGAFAVGTARGFGPPAVTAEAAAPFLQVGGLLVVSEPPDAQDRWPSGGPAALGFGDAELRRCGASFALLVLESPPPERFPRRTGVASKRPLF